MKQFLICNYSVSLRLFSEMRALKTGHGRNQIAQNCVMKKKAKENKESAANSFILILPNSSL